MTRPVKNNPQHMCVSLACPLGQLQIYLYLVGSNFCSCYGCIHSCYMLECLNVWIFTHKVSSRCRFTPVQSPLCRVVSAWKNGENRLNQVGLDEWNKHMRDKKYIHNFGSDTSRHNNLLKPRTAEKIILKLILLW